MSNSIKREISKKISESKEINENEEKAELSTKEYKEKLEHIKKEKEEIKDQLIRVTAEYENFRKRSIKEREQIYPEAISYAVSQFFVVIDSVKAAMTMKIKDAEFEKGIKLIDNSISIALKSLKIEELGKIGEIFDPKKHNAVLHIEDKNYKEGEIVEILQSGYKLNDKIIRHAMVKVAN